MNIPAFMEVRRLKEKVKELTNTVIKLRKKLALKDEYIDKLKKDSSKVNDKEGISFNDEWEKTNKSIMVAYSHYHEGDKYITKIDNVLSDILELQIRMLDGKPYSKKKMASLELKLKRLEKKAKKELKGNMVYNGVF